MNGIAYDQQLSSTDNHIKQLLWAQIAVNHPIKTCVLILSLPVITILLITLTKSFNLNDPDISDYLIRNDIRTRYYDAFDAVRKEYIYNPTLAKSQLQTIRQKDTTEKWSQIDSRFSFSILLRGRHNTNGPVGSPHLLDSSVFNVLSPEGLSLLKKVEDGIENDPAYKKFCYHDPKKLNCSGKVYSCAPILSVTGHPTLYGLINHNGICGRANHSQPVSNARFALFIASLYSVSRNGTRSLRPEYHRIFGKDFDSKHAGTWIIQSRVNIGVPFRGYIGNENQSEQEKDYRKFISALKKRISNMSTSKMNVDIFSIDYLKSSFNSIAFHDLRYSIAVLVLVFTCICIHTFSPFLALVAIIQAFVSFPLAFVVYRYILRQDYFSVLQILIIFFLLGIGADDVFVFTDTWKQAVVILGQDCDLLTRMSWTYRRAVKAMTITTITTAASFIVNAASPIMPISTLGIWAALLVIVQYILVITVYPCALVMWHHFCSTLEQLKLFKKSSNTTNEHSSNSKAWDISSSIKYKFQTKNEKNKYRYIERFFGGPWLKFINVLRFFLLPISVALIGTSIYFATKLKPLTELEEFLPIEHPLRKARNALTDAFPLSNMNNEINIVLVWGIKDVDRTGTSRFRTQHSGKPVLDMKFDFRRKEVQSRILQACDFFGKQRNLLVRNPSVNPVDCWISSYQNWRRANMSKPEFETFKDGKTQVKELLRFAFHKNERGEQPHLRFLTDQKFAFSKQSNRVVFTQLAFRSNLLTASPQPVMWKTYTQWQKLTTKFNAKSPRGANKMLSTAGIAWVWQMTQKNLMSSMFNGIGIMLVVSVVVLAVSTWNWIIAFMTTYTICGVVVSLLAAIKFLGWELGTVESIGVIIAVGYSFDGAAHIATAYIESNSETRHDRTKDAITSLGISILFGGITTLLAGAMLFLATLLPFTKFATIVVITITSSMIWSLAFLPAILLVLGPERSFGSLQILSLPFRYCLRKNTDDQQVGQGKSQESSSSMESDISHGPKDTSISVAEVQNLENQSSTINVEKTSSQRALSQG